MGEYRCLIYPRLWRGYLTTKVTDYPDMPESPEQTARREIDAHLTAAGWLVQDRDELDLAEWHGVSIGVHALGPHL